MAGVVRIAVSQANGYHVVPGLLAPLLHEHPELEIEPRDVEQQRQPAAPRG